MDFINTILFNTIEKSINVIKINKIIVYNVCELFKKKRIKSHAIR